MGSAPGAAAQVTGSRAGAPGVARAPAGEAGLPCRGHGIRRSHLEVSRDSDFSHLAKEYFFRERARARNGRWDVHPRFDICGLDATEPPRGGSVATSNLHFELTDQLFRFALGIARLTHGAGRLARGEFASGLAPFSLHGFERRLRGFE